MAEEQSWDWDTGEKRIPFGEWKENFRWVEEPYVSPDGEKIAAIVNIDEGQFSVCVNGETWEAVFDKIWHLRFTPSGAAYQGGYLSDNLPGGCTLANITSNHNHQSDLSIQGSTENNYAGAELLLQLIGQIPKAGPVG